MTAAQIKSLPAAKYPRVMVATDTGEVFVIRPGQPGSQCYILESAGAGRIFFSLTESRNMTVEDVTAFLNLDGFTLTIPANPGFEVGGLTTVFGPGTVAYGAKTWELPSDGFLLVAYDSDTDKVGVLKSDPLDVLGATEFGSNLLGASDAAAARTLLLLTSGVVDVADAIERKTAATYDPDGPVPGFTKVIQADTPASLWLLVGSTVSNDAHWIELSLAGEAAAAIDAYDTPFALGAVATATFAIDRDNGPRQVISSLDFTSFGTITVPAPTNGVEGNELDLIITDVVTGGDLAFHSDINVGLATEPIELDAYYSYAIRLQLIGGRWRLIDVLGPFSPLAPPPPPPP